MTVICQFVWGSKSSIIQMLSSSVWSVLPAFWAQITHSLLPILHHLPVCPPIAHHMMSACGLPAIRLPADYQLLLSEQPDGCSPPGDLGAMFIECFDCDMESVIWNDLMDGDTLNFNFDNVVPNQSFPHNVNTTTHSWVSGWVSEQATLMKPTSDCLTAGSERSSPKMSFNPSLVLI